MGKVNKSKKRGKTNSAAAPYATNASPARQDQTSVKLLQDMRSIDHSRRIRACDLLSGIFSNTSTFSSMLSLAALVGEELLGLLRMRLVDNNSDVKVAAMRALRNMASCKDQSVYTKIELCGIAGTVVQSARETLGSLSPATLEQAETVVGTLHSLCVWGEAVVRDLSTPSYLQNLLALAVSAPSPKLLSEVTGLLSVLAENNPPACSALAAVSVPSRSGSAVAVLVEGALGQWSPFGAHAETAQGDLRCAQLNCACTLTHLLGSPAGIAEVNFLETDTVPDVTRTGEPTCILLVLAHTLVASLRLSDEAIADSLCADVPVDYAQSPAEGAAGIGAMEEMTAAASPAALQTSNSRPEGGEDVTIGAEAKERPSQAAFGMIRLAVEVLGNFALMAKEKVNTPCGTTRGVPADGSGGADWSMLGEEEGERLMEQMASSMAVSHRNVHSAPASDSLYSRVITESGALTSCCQLLSQLHAILKEMSAGCVSEGSRPLPSSAIFVLETMELVTLTISNLSDYTLVQSINETAVSLAELLIMCSQMCVDVLYGVTPSTSFPGALESSAQAWSLSPCLDSKQAAVSARHAIVAGTQALASLYTAAHDASHMRPVSLLPPPTIAVVNAAGVSAAVSTLVPCLLRLLGVPIVEVNAAVCDMISCLAAAANAMALSQNENMVLTNALCRRLADPKAISIAPKVGPHSDASLAVSAVCYSSIVDLHSSDEVAYLEVYTRLNMTKILNENLTNFRSKMQVDGVTIDKEELSTYKEMYLNVKRFIKYKSKYE